MLKKLQKFLGDAQTKLQKKTCYSCKFFSQCNVDNLTCKDFTQDDGTLTTQNISGFTLDWNIKHKNAYHDKGNILLNKRVALSLKPKAESLPEPADDIERIARAALLGSTGEIDVL